jgi:hypothetical protein
MSAKWLQLVGSENDRSPDSLHGTYFAFDDKLKTMQLESRRYNNSWREFEVRDTLVYPVTFGTDLGEFETVDLFRISPQDTEGISGIAALEKGNIAPLKGSSLMAFGGFLDSSWRLSDMLRGRLDGADRLITAIVPDSDPQTVQVRQMLIREAQTAITKEWETFERELQIPPPKEHQSFFRRNWNRVARVVTQILFRRRDSKMKAASPETEVERPFQSAPLVPRQSKLRRFWAGLGNRIRKIGGQKNEHSVSPESDSDSQPSNPGSEPSARSGNGVT